MRHKILLAAALCIASGSAASEELDPLNNWQYSLPKQSATLYLAQADNSGMNSMATDETSTELVQYHRRSFTANNVHKYLGLGSIGSALLTVAAPKEYDGAHEHLARVAAGLGVGAVLTGLIFHYEEIELSNGFSDPDNLHMMLTSLGTLGYLAAVDKGGESGHAGLGVGGFLSMGIGIKMVW